MIRRRILTFAAVIGLMPTALVRGQDKPARLTFEVASIKPAKPGGRGGGIKALPGGQEYTAQTRHCLSLRSIDRFSSCRRIEETGRPATGLSSYAFLAGFFAIS